MSTSMVSTVLEIEREAEEILKAAEKDAAKIVADAKAKCVADSESAKAQLAGEVRRLEAQAAEEREMKVKELSAAGEASLSTLRSISDSAFDKGVRTILGALLGK